MFLNSIILSSSVFLIADEGDPKSSDELFTESGNEKSLDNLIPKSETDFLEYANFISQKLHQYEMCSQRSWMIPLDVSLPCQVERLFSLTLGLAFIDCSASSEPIGVLNRVVDLGCCIVIANKKPLTSSMEDYDKLLAYPRRIRHESTVQQQV
ncbi:hypothetical protein LOK49_LG08G00845 [Camellia lanceoleosa]|uniref:Uncharacterized protein n=1 Tax=Camellia lanceoleosa TaxID=1840588 RepID=A0ACC0GXM3_9ERIC|nr:hypothetical protein LOK49_LG08G00845 [Camellia lanceoleosa]